MKSFCDMQSKSLISPLRTHVNQRILVYMNGRFVAYYRVSTQRQGESGLGLDAQRHTVLTFLNGGKWQVEKEFIEVESGKRKTRPQLALALAECKRLKATLIIAKLDRLARNLHFVSGLMESGVEFLAVDNPTANRLTIHILAAVAEDEGRRISERTKAALAQAKARGVALGQNGKTLAKANSATADSFAMSLSPTIQSIRAKGIRSVRAIAVELNKLGILTPTGSSWHPTSVQRLLHRL